MVRLKRYNINTYIYSNETNFRCLRKSDNDPINAVYSTIFDKVKEHNIDLTKDGGDNDSIKQLFKNLIISVKLFNKFFNKNYNFISLCKRYDVKNVLDVIKTYRERKRKHNSEENPGDTPVYSDDPNDADETDLKIN